MKKLFSWILLIAIITSLFTTVSFASPRGMNLNEKVELLQTVEVLPLDENLEPNKAVTRGEFVKHLAKLLKIDTTVKSEERYYVDISEEDELWDITAQLIKCGILTVSEDRRFRANDIIQYKEAACALMKGYGAGSMDYEMYTQIAISLGLFEGVSYGDMSYKDTINLLYNAFVENPLTFTGNGMGPGKKTFMEINYDMFYIKGTVNAVNESVMDGGSAKPQTIRVDDLVIKCQIDNPYQYLGKEVGVFYKSEDDPEFVYIYTFTKDDDVIEITEKNLPVFDKDTFTLKYYNEDKKLKNIKISQNVNVVFNGEESTGDVAGAFENFTTGKITIMSSENRSGYDTVIIENYYNISVMSVSSEENIIYGKDGKKIDLSDDSKTIQIVDANGHELTLDKILNESVASIYESDVYMKIVVSNAVVSGTISKINNKAPVKLTVAETEYEIFPGAKLTYALGSQVSLHLDANGYIFAISAERKDGMLYGWILKHRITEVDGYDYVRLEVFTEKGEFLKITLSEKTIIDGTLRKTPDLQLFGLEQGNGGIVDQLILFKTDEKDFVKEIDTVYPNTAGGGLFKEFENSEGTYGSNSIGKLIWSSASTVVFVLPSAKNRGIEDAYAIGTKSLFEAWGSNDVDSYRTGDKGKPSAAEVIVLHRDMYDFAKTQRGAYIVDEIHSEWDQDEDEVRTIVKMMSGSSAKEFVLSNNFDDMDALVKGNIVTVGINGKNELGDVTLQYGTDAKGRDVKTQKEIGTWSDANHYIAIGKVVAVGDEFADLSITGDNIPTLRFPITTTNIGIYEPDGEKTIRVGTKGDIAEAMMQGNIVAVSMYRGTMVSIAIVKL